MADSHPSDELLIRFAAGRLADATGLILACHLEACPLCRARAANFEALAGDMLVRQDCTLPAPDDAALSRLVQRLDSPGQTPARAEAIHDATCAHTDCLPRPLRRFVPASLDDLPWGGMSRHIREYPVRINGRAAATLYHIDAGHPLPEHRHLGNEYTLVLEGGFSDHLGVYHQNDFVHATPAIRHRPRAIEGGDCLCLAVTDAPIRLTGIMGWLLTPWLRTSA
jgi:putative transcriptional regulator